MSLQENKQFYIGDSVVVSNQDYQFRSYSHAANQMGFLNFQENAKCVNGSEGVIVAICKHEYDNIELYGILTKDGGEYIFSEGGLSHAADKYTITLTEEEKDVLICALWQLGGCPINSPRKYAKSILNKIEQWRVTESDEDGEEVTKYRSLLKEDANCLIFNDFPKPVEKNTMNLKVELDTTDVKKDIEELKVLFEQIEVIKNRIFKGE